MIAMADDYITNWHGKPIDYLTRGELVDALDWCVKELRKHNEDYHHQSPRVTTPGNCEAPNGGGHTTADCPGAECRRTGQCQVA